MINGSSSPDHGLEQQKPPENENDTAEQVAEAERFQNIVANLGTLQILYGQLYAEGADPHNPLVRDTIDCIRANQARLLMGEPLAPVVSITDGSSDTIDQVAA